MSDSIGELLGSLMDTRGEEIVYRSALLKGLLADLSPRDTPLWQRLVLVQTVEFGIAAQMWRHRDREIDALIVDRWTNLLEESAGLRPDAAGWAIGRWTEALQIRVPAVENTGNPQDLLSVRGGMRREIAIEAFRRGSARDGRAWLPRRETDALASRLSDPITSEQALALKAYGFRELTENELNTWLGQQPEPLTSFINRVEQSNLAAFSEATQARRIRQMKEEQESATTFERLLCVLKEPIIYTSAGEMLNVLWQCWFSPTNARFGRAPLSDAPRESFELGIRKFIDSSASGGWPRSLKGLLSRRGRLAATSGEPITSLFESFWEALAPDERRPQVQKLWQDFLLPIRDRKGVPDDPLVNIASVELQHIRDLPDDEMRNRRYPWFGSVARPVKEPPVWFDLVYGQPSLFGLPMRFAQATPVRPPTSLVLRYYILSAQTTNVHVWLGADLEAQGRYFYNTDEDKEVVLHPREQVVSRQLSVASDLPAGDYFLNAGIWQGARSDTRNSVKLASVQLQNVRVLSEPRDAVR